MHKSTSSSADNFLEVGNPLLAERTVSLFNILRLGLYAFESAGRYFHVCVLSSLGIKTRYNASQFVSFSSLAKCDYSSRIEIHRCSKTCKYRFHEILDNQG